MALAVAAMLRPGIWRWAPVLTLGPYVVANLAAATLVALRRKNAKLAILLPIVFVCLHFPYGAGSVWGVLRALKAGMERRLRKMAEMKGRVPAKA
jgi:hypothetical protein